VKQTLEPASSNSSAAPVGGLPESALVAAIPRLRRYAQVLTRNGSRADDLVQDTLARAWAKRKLWRAGSDLRAWLFTIMHNVHVNHAAVARRDARTVAFDPEDESTTPLQPTAGGDPVDRVELREVMQQIDRLPAEQREVLLLTAVDGLHYGEIAALLSIPIGTVMSRVSRAREKLRRATTRPAATSERTERAVGS